MGLAHGDLESGQIELAHGALVHHGVGCLAAQLLAVHGEMLGGGGHALGLDAFDQACSHMTGHLGILGIVFKVSAAQGVALDVHARTQNHVDAQAPGLATQRLAHGLGQLRVP